MLLTIMVLQEVKLVSSLRIEVLVPALELQLSGVFSISCLGLPNYVTVDWVKNDLNWPTKTIRLVRWQTYVITMKSCSLQRKNYCLNNVTLPKHNLLQRLHKQHLLQEALHR